MQAKYFVKIQPRSLVALFLNGLSSWKKLLKTTFWSQLLGSVIKHDHAPGSELLHCFEGYGG